MCEPQCFHIRHVYSKVLSNPCGGGGGGGGGAAINVLYMEVLWFAHTYRPLWSGWVLRVWLCETSLRAMGAILCHETFSF